MPVAAPVLSARASFRGSSKSSVRRSTATKAAATTTRRRVASVTTSEYKVRQRVRAPRDRLSSAPRLPRGVARSRRARCRGVAARDREIAATVAMRSIARERKKNASLVPIRPRRRCERRSLRTFAVVSLRPGSLAFNPRPRRLSTTTLTDSSRLSSITHDTGRGPRRRGRDRPEPLPPPEDEPNDRPAELVRHPGHPGRRRGSQARSFSSRWFPYDRVGAVNADP